MMGATMCCNHWHRHAFTILVLFIVTAVRAQTFTDESDLALASTTYTTPVVVENPTGSLNLVDCTFESTLLIRRSSLDPTPQNFPIDIVNTVLHGKVTLQNFRFDATSIVLLRGVTATTEIEFSNCIFEGGSHLLVEESAMARLTFNKVSFMSTALALFSDTTFSDQTYFHNGGETNGGNVTFVHCTWNVVGSSSGQHAIALHHVNHDLRNGGTLLLHQSSIVATHTTGASSARGQGIVFTSSSTVESGSTVKIIATSVEGYTSANAGVAMQLSGLFSGGSRLNCNSWESFVGDVTLNLAEYPEPFEIVGATLPLSAITINGPVGNQLLLENLAIRAFTINGAKMIAAAHNLLIRNVSVQDSSFFNNVDVAGNTLEISESEFASLLRFTSLTLSAAAVATIGHSAIQQITYTGCSFTEGSQALMAHASVGPASSAVFLTSTIIDNSTMLFEHSSLIGQLSSTVNSPYGVEMGSSVTFREGSVLEFRQCTIRATQVHSSSSRQGYAIDWASSARVQTGSVVRYLDNVIEGWTRENPGFSITMSGLMNGGSWYELNTWNTLVGSVEFHIAEYPFPYHIKNVTNPTISLNQRGAIDQPVELENLAIRAFTINGAKMIAAAHNLLIRNVSVQDSSFFNNVDVAGNTLEISESEFASLLRFTSLTLSAAAVATIGHSAIQQITYTGCSFTEGSQALMAHASVGPASSAVFLTSTIIDNSTMLFEHSSLIGQLSSTVNSPYGVEMGSSVTFREGSVLEFRQCTIRATQVHSSSSRQGYAIFGSSSAVFQTLSSLKVLCSDIVGLGSGGNPGSAVVLGGLLSSGSRLVMDTWSDLVGEVSLYTNGHVGLFALDGVHNSNLTKLTLRATTSTTLPLRLTNLHIGELVLQNILMDSVVSSLVIEDSTFTSLLLTGVTFQSGAVAHVRNVQSGHFWFQSGALNGGSILIEDCVSTSNRLRFNNFPLSGGASLRVIRSTFLGSNDAVAFDSSPMTNSDFDFQDNTINVVGSGHMHGFNWGSSSHVQSSSRIIIRNNQISVRTTSSTSWNAHGLLFSSGSNILTGASLEVVDNVIEALRSDLTPNPGYGIRALGSPSSSARLIRFTRNTIPAGIYWAKFHQTPVVFDFNTFGSNLNGGTGHTMNSPNYAAFRCNTLNGDPVVAFTNPIPMTITIACDVCDTRVDCDPGNAASVSGAPGAAGDGCTCACSGAQLPPRCHEPYSLPDMPGDADSWVNLAKNCTAPLIGTLPPTPAPPTPAPPTPAPPTPAPPTPAPPTPAPPTPAPPTPAPPTPAPPTPAPPTPAPPTPAPPTSETATAAPITPELSTAVPITEEQPSVAATSDGHTAIAPGPPETTAGEPTTDIHTEPHIASGAPQPSTAESATSVISAAPPPPPPPPTPFATEAAQSEVNGSAPSTDNAATTAIAAETSPQTAAPPFVVVPSISGASSCACPARPGSWLSVRFHVRFDRAGDASMHNATIALHLSPWALISAAVFSSSTARTTLNEPLTMASTIFPLPVAITTQEFVLWIQTGQSDSEGAGTTNTHLNVSGVVTITGPELPQMRSSFSDSFRIRPLSAATASPPAGTPAADGIDGHAAGSTDEGPSLYAVTSIEPPVGTLAPGDALTLTGSGFSERLPSAFLIGPFLVPLTLVNDSVATGVVPGHFVDPFPGDGSGTPPDTLSADIIPALSPTGTPEELASNLLFVEAVAIIGANLPESLSPEERIDALRTAAMLLTVESAAALVDELNRQRRILNATHSDAGGGSDGTTNGDDGDVTGTMGVVAARGIDLSFFSVGLDVTGASSGLTPNVGVRAVYRLNESDHGGSGSGSGSGSGRAGTELPQFAPGLFRAELVVSRVVSGSSGNADLSSFTPAVMLRAICVMPGTDAVFSIVNISIFFLPNSSVIDAITKTERATFLVDFAILEQLPPVLDDGAVEAHATVTVAVTASLPSLLKSQTLEQAMRYDSIDVAVTGTLVDDYTVTVEIAPLRPHHLARALLGVWSILNSPVPLRVAAVASHAVCVDRPSELSVACGNASLHSPTMTSASGPLVFTLHVEAPSYLTRDVEVTGVVNGANVRHQTVVIIVSSTKAGGGGSVGDTVHTAAVSPDSAGGGNGGSDGNSSVEPNGGAAKSDGSADGTGGGGGDARQGGLPPSGNIFALSGCAGFLHFLVLTAIVFLVLGGIKMVFFVVRRSQLRRDAAKLASASRTQRRADGGGATLLLCPAPNTLPLWRHVAQQHAWLGGLVLPCHSQCGMQHLNRLLVHVLALMLIISTVMEHFTSPISLELLAAFAATLAAVINPLTDMFYAKFSLVDKRAAAAPSLGTLAHGIDCLPVGRCVHGTSARTLTALHGIAPPPAPAPGPAPATCGGDENSDIAFDNLDGPPTAPPAGRDASIPIAHGGPIGGAASPMPFFDPATCVVVLARPWQLRGHALVAILALLFAAVVYVNTAHWCIEQLRPFYYALLVAVLFDFVVAQPVTVALTVAFRWISRDDDDDDDDDDAVTAAEEAAEPGSGKGRQRAEWARTWQRLLTLHPIDHSWRHVGPLYGSSIDKAGDTTVTPCIASRPGTSGSSDAA